MKKSYLMIAAAATLFAACSSNDTFKESINENNQQPFTFSAYADKVLKGSNSQNLQDFYPVFGVYGYKNVTRNGVATDETVFSNVPNEFFATDAQGTTVYSATGAKPSDEWTFVANSWYYEDVRYWDKMANSYSFFAIAPYEASPAPALAVGATYDNINIGSSSAKYDISNEKNLAIAGTPTAVPQAALTYSGFNKDYMLAAKNAARTSDVTLVFNHILAKLNVKIVKSDTYKGKQELKVNELKIAGLAKQGYYVYNTNFTTKGWTTDGTYARDIATDYSLTAATNYSGCFWLETLMFPQTATCSILGAQPTDDDMDDMYLYIKYQIGTETYEAYYDFAAIWKENASVNDTFAFAQGSEYTLTLTVGPDPIHFATQVTQWTQVESGLTVN